jgi:hypothetical protein
LEALVCGDVEAKGSIEVPIKGEAELGEGGLIAPLSREP